MGHCPSALVAGLKISWYYRTRHRSSQPTSAPARDAPLGAIFATFILGGPAPVRALIMAVRTDGRRQRPPAGLRRLGGVAARRFTCRAGEPSTRSGLASSSASAIIGAVSEAGEHGLAGAGWASPSMLPIIRPTPSWMSFNGSTAAWGPAEAGTR